MGQAVDEVLPGAFAGIPAPALFRRRPLSPARRRPLSLVAAVPAALAPGRSEYVLATGALFLLGRWPVLFFRERLAGVFGPPRWPDWQYDGVVRVAFALAELGVAAAAWRRVRPRTLLEQPQLLALVAFAWASTVWSVEPGLTLWRAFGFAGAAAVGVYLAVRFSLRDQLRIVAAATGIGAGGSIIAAVVAPGLATITAGGSGRWAGWSGIYFNRNELALTVAIGMLATGILLFEAEGRERVVLASTFVVEAVLMTRTGARTGPLALIGAGAAAAAMAGLRALGRRGRLTLGGASALALASIGVGGVVLRLSWDRVVAGVGRDTTLSSRTLIWSVDRMFLGMRPLGGWGFEAIWSHPLTAAQASDILHEFPYSSHNGYFEILVGLGWIGLVLLAAFLVRALVESFVGAWRSDEVVELWPLAFLLFTLAANVTESLFVSNETVWVLVVAAGVTASSLAARPAAGMLVDRRRVTGG